MTSLGILSVNRIYPKLLGAYWNNLSNGVRLFHSQDQFVDASGQFEVRHGQHPVARLLNRLLQMPAEGPAVPVTLSVYVFNTSERWCRSFAGRQLETEQRPAGDGILLERVGLLRLRLALSVMEGRLHYRSVGVDCGFRSFWLSIPSWLGPQVVATEEGIDDHSTRVSVTVTLPLIGELLCYRGTIIRHERVA